MTTAADTLMMDYETYERFFVRKPIFIQVIENYLNVKSYKELRK